VLGDFGHEPRRHLGHIAVVALEGLGQVGRAEREQGQFREELMAAGLFAHGSPQRRRQRAERLLESRVVRRGLAALGRSVMSHDCMTATESHE
jgi:hypothetical protein